MVMKKKSYKVYYVGDDSLTHAMTVRAKDHSEAIELVKDKTGSDIVTGAQRCVNPYLKAGFFVVVAIVIIALLIISYARTA